MGFLKRLIIDLFITVAAYLFIPVTISIIGHRQSRSYSLKTIKKIVTVNGALVWLIFQIIRISNGNTDASFAVFLWSSVAYWIMKKTLRDDAQMSYLRKDVVMSDLYDRLLFLCEEKGIHHRIMCKELGLSNKFMTDLERGRKNGVDAATVREIASYFNVTVEYILFGKEEKNETHYRNSNGEWVKITETAPASVSNEDVKIALFGGDTEEDNVDYWVKKARRHKSFVVVLSLLLVLSCVLNIYTIYTLFATDSVTNNQNVSDFYNTIDELTENANSMYATDEDILKYKYMNTVSSELGELYQQKREIQSGSLDDADKYEAVQGIQTEINEIIRESLDTYGSVNIDGGYATVGDIHYRRNDGEWVKITEKQLEKQNEVTGGLGISAAEYWSNKEEYDYAYDYPAKYAVAKSVGGYESWKTYTSELYAIKADKDESGKTISGSRKEKVIAYLNDLDADYGEKIILFKSEYNADDTYNADIIEYLNSREDISYEDAVTILTELGMTVHSDGTVTWD